MHRWNPFEMRTKVEIWDILLVGITCIYRNRVTKVYVGFYRTIKVLVIFPKFEKEILNHEG